MPAPAHDQVQDLVAPLREFLACTTPAAWIDWALENPALLLIDHANCEKKAAATALKLMFRYPQDNALASRMSRLPVFQVHALCEPQRVAALRLRARHRGLELPDETAAFPEISAGRHRFTVRFMRQRLAEERPTQVTDDVSFRLTCCVI